MNAADAYATLCRRVGAAPDPKVIEHLVALDVEGSRIVSDTTTTMPFDTRVVRRVELVIEPGARGDEVVRAIDALLRRDDGAERTAR